MRVNLEWLRDWVELGDADSVAADLTTSGLEVESVEPLANVDRNVKARARVGLAIAAFVLVYAAIAARLVFFGVTSDGASNKRSTAHDAVATARPDILDRNGEILATDVRTPSLFAEPRKIIDVDEAVELLTAVLPNPYRRNAQRPSPGVRRIAARVQVRAARAGDIDACVRVR